MKTILLSLLTISALSADVVQNTEIQLDGWYADATGNFQDNGSVINLNQRGFENEITPSISIDIEGENKYMNLKLAYTRIAHEGKNSIDGTDIVHNGVQFDHSDEMMKANLELNVYDLIYYIDVPVESTFSDNAKVDVDFGLGVRYIDGTYSSKICSKNTSTDFDKYAPIGYFKSELIPNSHPSISWVNQILFYPDDIEHYDARTAIKVNITDGFSSELGYRAIHFHADETYNTSITSKGAYLGLMYKF